MDVLVKPQKGTEFIRWKDPLILKSVVSAEGSKPAFL